jgi:hypothetical protein
VQRFLHFKQNYIGIPRSALFQIMNSPREGLLLLSCFDGACDVLTIIGVVVLLFETAILKLLFCPAASRSKLRTIAKTSFWPVLCNRVKAVNCQDGLWLLEESINRGTQSILPTRNVDNVLSQ